MKIGDTVFIHGYIDEIRKDTVIIRNKGGYFGTIPSEVICGKIPEHKTGKWIELTNTNHTYVCSVCGRMLVNITDGKNKVAEHYPFCHCGARMVQEGEESWQEIV